MQLATTLTGFRRVLVLAGVAAGIAVVRLWPPPAESPPAANVTTFTYVPLLATGTSNALEDHDARWHGPLAPDAFAGGCVPWIEPLTAYRNWSITIARGGSGCTGSWVYDAFEIHADGRVTWHQDGIPDRTLQLTPAELAVIEHANQIDCVENTDPGYGRSWVRFAPGGDRDAEGGTTISNDTQLGSIIEWTLEGAANRYRAARLAALGETQLLLAAHGYDDKRYRVRVDAAGTVTVRRGSKTLYTTTLDDDQRITLYDHLLGRVALPLGRDEEGMVGRFVVGGVMLPVSLGHLGERWDFVWNALRSAEYVESER